MPVEGERYGLEEAQDEAAKMKQEVESGTAADYSTAEEHVEMNAEQRKISDEILEAAHQQALTADPKDLAKVRSLLAVYGAGKEEAFDEAVAALDEIATNTSTSQGPVTRIAAVEVFRSAIAHRKLDKARELLPRVISAPQPCTQELAIALMNAGKNDEALEVVKQNPDEYRDKDTLFALAKLGSQEATNLYLSDPHINDGVTHDQDIFRVGYLAKNGNIEAFRILKQQFLSRRARGPQFLVLLSSVLRSSSLNLTQEDFEGLESLTDSK